MLQRVPQLKSYSDSANVRVRPATSADSDGIARIFLESAEHHSRLDSALYLVPTFETVEERYRLGRQHPSGKENESITYVAEFEDEVIGFVDARLDKPTDAMHRDMVF